MKKLLIPLLKGIPPQQENSRVLVSRFIDEKRLRQEERKRISAYLNKPASVTSPFNTLVQTMSKEELLLLETSEIAKNKSLYYKNRLKELDILVVEDNKTNQDSVALMMESAGINVSLQNNFH